MSRQTMTEVTLKIHYESDEDCHDEYITRGNVTVTADKELSAFNRMILSQALNSPLVVEKEDE